MNDFKNYLKSREPFKSMQEKDYVIEVKINKSEEYKYQIIKLFDIFTENDIEFD